MRLLLASISQGDCCAGLFVFFLDINLQYFSPLYFCLILMCVHQIVGNGSEQQLQKELEDVLMDPSVADAGLGSEAMSSLGPSDHGVLPNVTSPVPAGTDPLSSPPPKLEMVLPVQTAQESELNERSYRGEEGWHCFSLKQGK